MPATQYVGYFWALEYHLGYAPDDTDRHDMRLLAHRFGLRLPPAYS